MTGAEIMASTPWEINQRIKGYEERMRVQRIFYANFVTAPVINAAGHPKHPITAKKIVPDDFYEYSKATKAEKKRLVGVMRETEAERRRLRGGT